MRLTNFLHKGYVKRVENINANMEGYVAKDMEGLTPEEAAAAYAEIIKEK